MLAVCTSILLGMQLGLRQVPPKAPDSISATGPCTGPWRSECLGTRTLPEPEPMMTSEK